MPADPQYTTETRTVGAGTLTSTVRRWGPHRPDLTVQIDTECGASFVANCFSPTSSGLLMPLTPCCKATAKGFEDCIGCRKCCAEVDPAFGDCSHLESAAQSEQMVAWIMADHFGCADADAAARQVVAAVRDEAQRQLALLGG